MLVYGELIRAQAEQLSSDPSALLSRFWFNTTEVRMKYSDGTLLRALLGNDQKCVFGNNGTASSNIRLNRAAAAVLQFVTGDDTTAEGSLSTALAQLSFKHETYATGSIPSAGVAGRVVYDSTLNVLKVDNGTYWRSIGPHLGYTTTATAAGTTTLVASSDVAQFFTGTTTQTVVLPVTSTLYLGQQFHIHNNSTGVVTVQSSGANTIVAMAAGTVLILTCISLSGTGTSSWDSFYSVVGPAVAANTVYAGPTSGGSATPTFRALVAADISSLIPEYSTTSGSLDNDFTGGTYTVTRVGALVTVTLNNWTNASATSRDTSALITAGLRPAYEARNITQVGGGAVIQMVVTTGGVISLSFRSPTDLATSVATAYTAVGLTLSLSYTI